MRALALKGEANIYEITAIQDKIIKSWDGKGPLKIDLSKVEEVDGSFIQLLLSCKQAAIAVSQPLELVKMTDDFREKLDAMYVSDFLFTETVEEDGSTEKEGE